MAQPIHFQALVRDVRRHADDVISLDLQSDRRLPVFRPGQFIHLALDRYEPGNHWPESRVFSAASSVADRRSIRLTISRQGAFTSRIIREVRQGMVLPCKGPYGSFVVDAAHPEGTVALVAGGTGITPFAALMEKLVQDPSSVGGAVRLYYGARRPELLIYRDLADQCAAALPHFHVFYYLEEDGEEVGAAQGLLDINQIARESGPRAAYYLSGPQRMIASFRDRLIACHGAPPEAVWVDAWE